MPFPRSLTDRPSRLLQVLLLVIVIVTVVLCAVGGPEEGNTGFDTVLDAFKDRPVGSIAWLLGALLVFWVLKTVMLVTIDKNYGKTAKPVAMSPEMKAVLHGGVADDAASPPPSLNVKDHAGATVVTGQLWAELLRAGFVVLSANHEHCNKINVFPVADRDTGFNMLVSLRSAVAAIGPSPDKDLSVDAAMNSFSSKVLLSAQGNSGTILCFLFTRLRQQMDGTTTITVPDLAKAIGEVGGMAMTGAMGSASVTGTLLSVLEEGCQAVAAAKPTTVGQLATVWHDASNTALAKTPDQLVVNGKHVLRDANVVDSGAQGLVFFLQGMAEAVRGELVYGDDYLRVVIDSGNVAENSFGSQEMHDVGDEGDLEFAYCTECVMQISESADQVEAKAKITEAISDIGNSIVSVVSEVGKSDSGAPLLLAKVHVHTNDPGESTPHPHHDLIPRDVSERFLVIPELAFSRLRPMCCNRVLIKQKAEVRI